MSKGCTSPCSHTTRGAESEMLLFLAAFLLHRSANTRSVIRDVQLVAILLPCTCLHSHNEFQEACISSTKPWYTGDLNLCTFALLTDMKVLHQTAPDCLPSILIAHQLPFSPLCLQCPAGSVGSGEVRPTPEVADRRHTPGRRGCDNNFVPQN